jgi:hypothetical protein
MTPEIILTTIQIVPTRPEEADLRKIRYYAAEKGIPVQEVSYIVKLYISSAPIYDNLGFELYVGNEKIRKYSQFKNGIYFKINDSHQLSVLQGQKVRFRRPGSERFIETDVVFPSEEVTEQLLEPKQLPTQEEVLRK